MSLAYEINATIRQDAASIPVTTVRLATCISGLEFPTILACEIRSAQLILTAYVRSASTSRAEFCFVHNFAKTTLPMEIRLACRPLTASFWCTSINIAKSDQWLLASLLAHGSRVVMLVSCFILVDPECGD